MLNKIFQKLLITTFIILMLSGIVFSQTVHTFTNAGKTGSSGPSQSDVTSAYTGTSLEDKVDGIEQDEEEEVMEVIDEFENDALVEEKDDIAEPSNVDESLPEIADESEPTESSPSTESTITEPLQTNGTCCRQFGGAD